MQRNNVPLLLLILLLGMSALTACSQNEKHFTLIHPGNYELIDLGKANNTEDSFHAYKVHTKIFHASPRTVYPSEYSVYLLEHTVINEGESVLDIGTGTGVQAIFAADKASRVLAMDINPDAIKDTAHNARRLGVADKVSVRESDLFNALTPDEKFDVIISDLPLEMWELQERFFREVGKYLNRKGRIYFSTNLLDSLPRTQSLIEKNKLKIVRINMDYFRVSDVEHIVYEIKHEKHAQWLDKDLAPQN